MKKLFIIPALLGAMFLTSCEDFLNVNTTKDSPITTSVDQVLPVACFYASQICYDHAEYGVYLSQALTTSGKSQTGSYPYSQGWEFLGVNRHPMWRRHFYDLGANIKKMNEIAEENGNRNAILIGRTIMLASTMFTTDAFGDMPRSEVYQSAAPKYDSQQEVYDWMFAEAEELIRLYNDPTWVNCPTNIPITEKMDRIYAGDMKKWEMYCRAIQARLWLRKLPNWDNTPATCQKIIEMVDHVLNDANWQEPRYYYPGGVTESNCPWGPFAPKINSWESRDNRLASSIPTTFFLHGILGGIDKSFVANRGYALDPRAAKIFEQRSSEKGAMLHLESNIGMDQSKKLTNYPDLYASTTLTNPYTQNTGYIALITQEELMFIKAEAQYWAGDNAGAYNTTMEATKFNMERYGMPEAQVTNGSLGTNLKNQYRRFFDIKFKTIQDNFNIADIMQQKYVAMYLQPEQWTDMRRYNYSSSTNGIAYYDPKTSQPVYVYTVKHVHNGVVAQFSHRDPLKSDSVNFYDKQGNPNTYSLRRPYNLYEAYWCTPEDYANGVDESEGLSPNAWVARLNADTETETKYNKKELDRIGYYTTNAAGEKILDFNVLKRRMIWAHKNNDKVVCSNNIEWK